MSERKIKITTIYLFRTLNDYLVLMWHERSNEYLDIYIKETWRLEVKPNIDDENKKSIKKNN